MKETHLLLTLLAAAALFACGGGKNVRAGGGDEAPAWVAQGSGAFNGEAGRKLQGVGQSRSSDPKGRRQSADAGAQRQLMGSVDALAAGLARMTESAKDNAGEEIGALTRKAAAASPHVHDHYVTGDGAESALDQIELGAFKQALQAVDGDEGLKRELTGNADRAFDQLARQ